MPPTQRLRPLSLRAAAALPLTSSSSPHPRLLAPTMQLPSAVHPSAPSTVAAALAAQPPAAPSVSPPSPSASGAFSSSAAASLSASSSSPSCSSSGGPTATPPSASPPSSSTISWSVPSPSSRSSSTTSAAHYSQRSGNNTVNAVGRKMSLLASSPPLTSVLDNNASSGPGPGGGNGNGSGSGSGNGNGGSSLSLGPVDEEDPLAQSVSPPISGNNSNNSAMAVPSLAAAEESSAVRKRSPPALDVSTQSEAEVMVMDTAPQLLDRAQTMPDRLPSPSPSALATPSPLPIPGAGLQLSPDDSMALDVAITPLGSASGAGGASAGSSVNFLQYSSRRSSYGYNFNSPFATDSPSMHSASSASSSVLGGAHMHYSGSMGLHASQQGGGGSLMHHHHHHERFGSSGGNVSPKPSYMQQGGGHVPSGAATAPSSRRSSMICSNIWSPTGTAPTTPDAIDAHAHALQDLEVSDREVSERVAAAVAATLGSTSAAASSSSSSSAASSAASSKRCSISNTGGQDVESGAIDNNGDGTGSSSSSERDLSDLVNQLRNPVHGLMALVDLLDNSPAFGNLPEEREMLRTVKVCAQGINTIVSRNAAAAAAAAESKERKEEAQTTTSLGPSQAALRQAATALTGGNGGREAASSSISSGNNSSSDSSPSKNRSESRADSRSDSRASGASLGMLSAARAAYVMPSTPHPSATSGSQNNSTNAGGGNGGTGGNGGAAAAAAAMPQLISPSNSTPSQSSQLSSSSPLLLSSNPPSRPPTVAPGGGGSGLARSSMLTPAARNMLGATPPTAAVMPPAELLSSSSQYSVRPSRAPSLPNPSVPSVSGLIRGSSGAGGLRFDLSSLNVLIVDDMSLNRKVLRKMLESIPAVDVAADGLQAVEMVKRKMETALRITLPPLDLDRIAKENATPELSSHAPQAEPNYDAALAAMQQQQQQQQQQQHAHPSSLHVSAALSSPPAPPDSSSSSHLLPPTALVMNASASPPSSLTVAGVSLPSYPAMSPEPSPLSSPGESVSITASSPSLSSGTASSIMLTHASTPAASSAMSSLPPQVYSTAAAVSAASSKPTVGATGGHNRAVSGLFGAATAGVPAPLAGAALTHLGAISTGQSFELPPSQARYSDLGRHHSFPSIPLPPSAAAAHLRASERDSGSASMQFGMSSNSLSQINMSRSASGQRSGGHTPTDFGLQSPQSPATPVIMPRTPSLEGTYYHSSVMYNPLQHAASSFVSPTAQQQRSSARHFTMPLPLRGPNAPLTPQSQSLSNNPVGQTSTASAVMHAHKAQYDVIVTDLCMPRCSGLQEASLVRELEAACGLPPVPIIAVTSNTLLSDRMACARRDITWFLCKPFTRKDILSVLELIVHERALQPLSLAPLRRSLQLSALSAASTPRYGSSAFPSSLHSSHLANCSVSAPGSELLSPRCPPPFLTMLPAAALHSSPKAERQISITDSGGTSCKSSSHRAPSASPPDGKGASAGAGGASGAACGLSATLFSSPSERSDTGTNDSDSSNDFASPLASRSLMALRSNSGGGGDSTSTCASLQSESSSGTNSNLEFASATAALLSTSSPDSTPTPNATLAIGVQTSLSTAAPSLSSFGGSRRHSRSESGSESGPTSRPLTAFSASGDWPTSSNVTTSVAQARTERPTQQEQAHKHEDE